jgi:hypothetical protein
MVLCAASSVIGPTAVGLVVGVASALLSVLLLFSIKPSLRLTWEEGSRSKAWWKHPPEEEPSEENADATQLGVAKAWVRCSQSESDREEPTVVGRCPKCGRAAVHYRVEIENLGLSKVLEIEPRLLLVRRRERTLATREWMPLEAEKLLELNGKWHEVRRQAYELDERVGDSFYHFFMPCAVSPAALSGDDYYLIQVWARHGFTNFGRVHKLRIRLNERPWSSVSNGFSIDAPDDRKRLRRVSVPSTRFIAGVFATRATRRVVKGPRKQRATSWPSGTRTSRAQP